MILYLFIFFILSICACVDWKKTVLLWFPVQMCFNECVCLKYTSPAVTLNLAVDAMLLGMYYVKGKRDKSLNQGDYIYRHAFIAMLISYLVSMVFSIVPFKTVLTGTIKYFIESFIILYLLHKALNSLNDIKFILFCYLGVSFLIASLGVFEAIFQDNPWLDFVWLNSDVDAIEGKMYYTPPIIGGDLGTRFGMVRCFSFFSIHIAYGWAAIMMFYLFTFVFVKYKNLVLNNIYLVIGIVLSLLGVLLCNSKTPMVGIAFFVLGLFKTKDIFNIRNVILLVVIIIGITMYMPDYLNNFFALFDSDLAEEGGGSNMEMRKRQYEVGWTMFSQNPLFGNGIGSIQYMMAQNSRYDDLKGSESLWLKILPQRGILGLVTYVYGFYTIYRTLRKNLTKRMAISLLGGILAMATATPLNNFYIWGAVILICNRLAYITNKSKMEQKYGNESVNISAGLWR